MTNEFGVKVTYNMVYPKARQMFFNETIFLISTLVNSLSVSARTSRLRVYPNRYATFLFKPPSMLDKYNETFMTWNKVASLYQEKFMNLDLYNETYDYICENLKNDRAKILDVGCGPGNITKYLLSKRKDFDILGIDVASNMIELARKNNPNARFSIMDVRKLNELDATFDCIISGFCLPYLSQNDFERFLNDIYRLLNNNRLIYLSFVEGDSISSGYQTASSGDKVYFCYYSEDFVKSKLAENKLSDIKTFKVQYKRTETEIEIHTIMIAIKTMA